MDIRKVFDQTVRELKREVNKKVLKVPEIEQKVLDATSNEPWGPHGTLMSEIAMATRSYGECQMILSVLWRRLADTGKNWRHVYKSLTVMEFIVAHGSEKAIDELREHSFQIRGLFDFQYVEPSNGKDEGLNVRKKSQSLVALLTDKDKIREARQKAASNKDKYQGFSSSGTGNKPSSYSKGFYEDKYTGNGRYGGGDKYGSSPGRYNDDDKYRDDDERYSDEDFRKKDDPPTKHALSQPVETTSFEDDDDFDPRAASAPAPPPKVPPKVEVDLLDLFSSPSPPSSSQATASVDPFATDFLSSVPTTTQPTEFAAFTSAPSSDFGAFTPSVAAPVDPFAAFGDLQTIETGNNSHFGDFQISNDSQFGDFQTGNDNHLETGNNSHFGDIPSNNQFGDFQTEDNSQASFNAFEEAAPAFGDFQTSDAPASSNGTSNGNGTTHSKHDKFEAKSGSIWDDPLSSELINLKISAPKSTALADLGITDWSFDEKPMSTTAAATQPVNKAMGLGSGLGLAGATGLSPPPPQPSVGASSTGLSFFNEKPQQADPFAAFQDEWKFSSH